MQAVLSIVLLVIGFLSGIYYTDNVILVDCMKVGQSKANGTQFSCNVPRPPEPQAPVQATPHQPDNTSKEMMTKMFDMLLRKMDDVEKRDRAERVTEQPQVKEPAHQIIYAKPAQPVVNEQPKIIKDTEEEETPPKTR